MLKLRDADKNDSAMTASHRVSCELVCFLIGFVF